MTLIGAQYAYDLKDIKFDEHENKVTTTFSNEESIEGSLIIGSDGPRSKVREMLLGPEQASATPMEIVHSNVAVVYHDVEKAKFIRSPHPSFNAATILQSCHS